MGKRGATVHSGLIHDVENKYIASCDFWGIRDGMFVVGYNNRDYIFHVCDGLPDVKESYMVGYTNIGWARRKAESTGKYLYVQLLKKDD